MLINIKYNAGDYKTIVIFVGPWMGVEDVQALIQDRFGLPPQHQRLLVAGKQLDSALSLSACNIQDGSTIECLLRAGGGECGCCS